MGYSGVWALIAEWCAPLQRRREMVFLIKGEGDGGGKVIAVLPRAPRSSYISSATLALSAGKLV